MVLWYVGARASRAERDTVNAVKKPAVKKPAPVAAPVAAEPAPVAAPVTPPAPTSAETPRAGGPRAGGTRQPNISEEKTRVAAYLTRALADTLAHRCVDLHLSQSEAVTFAIVAWLGANAPAAQKPAAK